MDASLVMLRLGGAHGPATRRAVVWLSASRVAGTVLAQLMLLPAAFAIAMIARAI